MKSLICVEDENKVEITTVETGFEQLIDVLLGKYTTFSKARELVESDVARWGRKTRLDNWENLEMELPDSQHGIEEFCNLLCFTCKVFTGFAFRYRKNEDREYGWQFYCMAFSRDWIPLRIVRQYPFGQYGTVKLEGGVCFVRVEYLGYSIEHSSSRNIVWVQCETEYGNRLEFNEDGDVRYSHWF